MAKNVAILCILRYTVTQRGAGALPNGGKECRCMKRFIDRTLIEYLIVGILNFILCTGIMFLLTIFLAPLFVAIPYAATGPALIYVGFLMLKGFTEIDFTDYDESIGPCVMMMFTAFTGNITNGLGAGIIVHVLVKLVRGKAKEIHPIMYLLCALMVLYFIVG